MAKHTIHFGPAAHHQLKTPYGSVYHEAKRILVIAEGVCNGKSFDAVLHYDVGLGSDLHVFSLEKFPSNEYNVIRARMKKLPAATYTDWREQEDDPQVKLFNELELKHYGVRTYLNVPLSEKDEVSKLGAKWDPTTRQWYYLSKQHNAELFKKWSAS